MQTTILQKLFNKQVTPFCPCVLWISVTTELQVSKLQSFISYFNVLLKSQVNVVMD